MAYSQWVVVDGLEIKTQSDLYFEKTPFGLYVESQLEDRNREGRPSATESVWARGDDSLAWAGRGRWKVRGVDTFEGYLESKIRKTWVDWT